jgi:chemotaxis protein CheX
VRAPLVQADSHVVVSALTPPLQRSPSIDADTGTAFLSLARSRLARAGLPTLFIAPMEDLFEVLGERVWRGAIRLGGWDLPAAEVTILHGVAGQLSGLVAYTMSEARALALVSGHVRRRLTRLDPDAQMRLGELANMIVTTATQHLDGAGWRCEAAPAVVAVGRESAVTLLGPQPMVVPLHTAWGTLEVHIGLRLEEPVEGMPLRDRP